MRKKAEREFRDLKKQQSANEDQIKFTALLVEKVKDDKMRFRDFLDLFPRDARVGGRMTRDEQRELFDRHLGSLGQVSI